jgi:hypothetical protein
MTGEIIRRVKKSMIGRIAVTGNNVTRLLEIVKEAGDGNYLEIGILHGGSLCCVALLKKQLGYKGKCYGIDPLNGYYIERVPSRTHKLDIESWIPVTEDTVNENIRIFGIENEVEIIKAKSDPFPINKDIKFNVAYIDGDHWENGPKKDWDNIKNLVTDYVIFDDYDDRHPAVKMACTIASGEDNWGTYLSDGITYVLRRVA